MLDAPSPPFPSQPGPGGDSVDPFILSTVTFDSRGPCRGALRSCTPRASTTLPASALEPGARTRTHVLGVGRAVESECPECHRQLMPRYAAGSSPQSPENEAAAGRHRPARATTAIRRVSHCQLTSTLQPLAIAALPVCLEVVHACQNAMTRIINRNLRYLNSAAHCNGSECQIMLRPQMQ